MLRSFLLAPCLLICLACATTPFPIESLKEGMTAETVRENFGEPVATNTVWDPPGGDNFLWGNWSYDAESSWTYVDEDKTWAEGVVWSLIFPV